MSGVLKKPLHDRRTASFIETMLVKAGKGPGYVSSMKHFSNQFRTEAAQACRSARRCTSVNECDQLIDSTGDWMRDASLQQVKALRAAVRGLEVKKRSLKDGRHLKQLPANSQRWKLVESLLTELKPSKVLVDQECIDELYTGIMTGVYSFSQQDLGKNAQDALLLCQKADMYAQKRVVQEDVSSLTGKLRLGAMKSKFDKMSGAYDYFNHRKFRMNPDKPKTSWTIAGMTNPRKRSWKVLRRNWHKTSAAEKLDASDPVSVKLARHGDSTFKEYIIGKVLVMYHTRTKRAFLLSQDNVGDLRKCFLIASNSIIASFSTMDSEANYEGQSQHSRKLNATFDWLIQQCKNLRRAWSSGFGKSMQCCWFANLYMSLTKRSETIPMKGKSLFRIGLGGKEITCCWMETRCWLCLHHLELK